MKVSRAGTVFRQGNGVSSQKRGNTIFFRPKSSDPRSEDDSKEEKKPHVVLLQEFAENSPRILYHIKTVFPFVLFTDKIILDEIKITVAIGNFFESEEVRSVLIKDLASITVDGSYLFATVNIVDRHFITEPIRVKYVWKTEAHRLRRMVMGLMIAKNNDIELAEYNNMDVCKYIEKIGSAHIVQEAEKRS